MTPHPTRLGRALFGYRPTHVRQFLLERDIWIRDADKRIQAARAKEEEAQTELATRKEDLAEREGQLATLKKDLAQHEGEFATLKKDLAQREGEVASLREQLAQGGKELGALKQALASRDKELATRNEGLAEGRSERAILKDELTNREREVATLREQLAQRDKELATLSEQLDNRDAEHSASTDAEQLPPDGGGNDLSVEYLREEARRIMGATEEATRRIIERGKEGLDRQVETRRRIQAEIAAEMAALRAWRESADAVRGLARKTRNVISEVPDKLRAALGSLDGMVMNLDEKLDQLGELPEPPPTVAAESGPDGSSDRDSVMEVHDEERVVYLA